MLTTERKVTQEYPCDELLMHGDGGALIEVKNALEPYNEQLKREKAEAEAKKALTQGLPSVGS